ncbi:MAG TPA: sigma 54-interacting transcriptional regulator [Chondromyces sp.]|nr:sigma 54-interacting transcriptional regulator [Chondromyces sp.]
MSAEAGPAAPSRILVVDDEESIRFTFRSFLEKEGHKTITAASYEEAMGFLREMEFDLVFVDIILEGKSGIDLLRDSKKLSQKSDFIVITGAPSVETAANAVRLGAFDYIVKPIRHGDLMRITDKALGHRALRHAEESYRLNLEAIFRSVRDAIITVDEEMTVVEVNPAAGVICGISRDEASGKAFPEIPLKCSGKCLDALQDTVARKERIDIPCVECAALDDPHQIVSITASPLLRQDGTASGGVLVIRNETRLVELERCLAETRQLGRIIGTSKGIRDVFSMIEALADVRTSVLVTGESGTGKELVADALHAAGSRCEKHLVKINCAALSEGLLESELFGHVRGAFTGAVKDKVGRFQRANGGTIFLDEIGEMTASMQLRLLRVLETMEFERVGDSTPVKVDVRVIAATNRDLRQKVKAGEFREDLYFRLKVVEIHLPPLRERRDDIPLLVQHFLESFNEKFSKQVTGISESVMDLFMKYHWPGNIRQLENVLEHAFVLCRRNVITPRELPTDFMPGDAARPGGSGHDPGSADIRAILEALEQTGHNKSEAARLLGISRRTLYRKLEQHKAAD